ncbi:hypothetical protein GJ496_002909 [Pomphorhynchus laevis]|nr:hypothetical protein GJ496_002909 [Pomphorhynchus laevis]
MFDIEDDSADDYDFLLKLLALGDSGVGKTTFLHRYTSGEFNSRFVATIGIDFREKKLDYYWPKTNTGKPYHLRLQLWVSFQVMYIRLAKVKLYYIR